MEQAFKVWCEYDFGGNINGYTGVYSTKQKCIDAVNFVMQGEGISFNDLEIKGLARIEPIII